MILNIFFLVVINKPFIFKIIVFSSLHYARIQEYTSKFPKTYYQLSFKFTLDWTRYDTQLKISHPYSSRSGSERDGNAFLTAINFNFIFQRKWKIINVNGYITKRKGGALQYMISGGGTNDMDEDQQITSWILQHVVIN